MAIYTPQQLASASNATYTTNGANAITAATVRSLNSDWISSSVLLNANNNISGSQVISGSLRLIGNGDRLTITGSTAGTATTFSDRTMNALAYQAPGVDVASQLFSSDTAAAGQYIGALKSDFSVDVEHAIIVTTSSITLNDWDNNGGVYVPYLTIKPNTGNNPAPVLTRGVGVSGSVNGNVQAIVVSSNTASINLATGNFFTTTLANSATTFFNVTNVTPGLTTNLVLTTGTVSSASFSSNVKQVSGNTYLPTSGSGQIDVLSLVAVDASNVYLVASKKFA